MCAFLQCYEYTSSCRNNTPSRPHNRRAASLFNIVPPLRKRTRQNKLPEKTRPGGCVTKKGTPLLERESPRLRPTCVADYLKLGTLVWNILNT